MKEDLEMEFLDLQTDYEIISQHAEDMENKVIQLEEENHELQKEVDRLEYENYELRQCY